MKQFIVQQNEAGQRLDKLLAKILNKAPKSFLYKMLRKKNITLNGKKADGAEKLNMDDLITLFLSDDTIAEFSEQFKTVSIDTTSVASNIHVIYEDEHVLFVNKPLGVLSQKAEKNDISMVEYIIAYLLSAKQITVENLKSFKPAICNRLDRNTSGILIAGKSLIGLQEMAKLLKDRTLDKYYLCIVKGKVETKQRIEGYLTKDEMKNQVKIHQKQMEDTEYICTEYEPISFSKKPSIDPEDYTLLQVKLITGRSHQIRAHLASIGHPILGDFKYGDKKTNQLFKNKYGLTHQLLHSYRMKLPKLEGELSYLSNKEFQAELPEIFSRIKKDLMN
ncbi:MAG: RluA family pseudouridine synthase [Mobilitalea sp.]